jgi:atypical dual specificity phosphatase
MSTPRTAEDIGTLSGDPLHMECIVTLTEEEPLPEEWFTDVAATNVFLPVPNYKAPTIAQVKHFINIVTRDGKRTLVHCGGGKGRAGTFLACYLATCGFTVEIKEQPAFTANQAMDIIRKMRPGSIETQEQEYFIASYVSHLWKHGFHDTISEPEGCLLEITGRFSPKASFICLVGIPGSGKSTFAKQLVASSSHFEVISQDEMGSKEACFTAMAKAVKEKRRVIIDRCNTAASSRKELISAAFGPVDAMCIFFDYTTELCEQRANTRTDHPTIKQGKAGMPVKSMAKTLESPKKSEGFECVVRVASLGGVNELLRKFGVRAQREGENNSSSPAKKVVKKFPRTRHLLNLGSASRDDLIFSAQEVEDFLRPRPGHTFVVQEKIDGANMGISVNPETQDFLVQNRSHFVNSKSHLQFKSLDLWLSGHRDSLWQILMGEHNEAGRFVLFGEWMAAEHAIHYARLPDTFVAFDLYDAKVDKFVSVDTLESMLKDLDISVVPSIASGDKFTAEELRRMVAGNSQFYDGPMEGAYIRKDSSEGRLLDRAKIVRSDFICGNEHWTKGVVVWNGYSNV